MMPKDQGESIPSVNRTPIGGAGFGEPSVGAGYLTRWASRTVTSVDRGSAIDHVSYALGAFNAYPIRRTVD